MIKKMIFVIVFTIFIALPTVAAEKIKFNINASGLLVSVSQGYDFDFRFDSRLEAAKWTESVANLGSAFGFNVGVGIYPISQLEVYASYSSYGGTALGDYSLRLPHFLWYDETVNSDIGGVENEIKTTVVNFGLAFHPAVKGKIKPYFGGGLSNGTVKVDFLDKVVFTDLWEWDYYEDLWIWWERGEESINITRVEFREMSEKFWRFHAKAGVNIEVAKNICIFAEACYFSATVKFDRPDVTFEANITLDYYEDYYGSVYEFTDTWTDELDVNVDDEIEIKAGGVQGIIGIKFTF